MKSKTNTVLSLGAVLSLAVVGAGCPESQVKGNFNNVALTSAIRSTTSTKSWKYTQVIDLGAVDTSSSGLRHDQNKPFTAFGTSVWRAPMTVFNDAAKSFYVGFTRADTEQTYTANTMMNLFVTQKTDITGLTAWVRGYSDFTQMDLSVLDPSNVAVTTIDSIRPISVVDNAGNATLVYFNKNANGGTRKPIGSRHNYGSGFWTAPKLLYDTALTDDVSTSAALGADAFNNAVFVYQQNGAAYFNEYRTNLGWRFSGTPFDATAQWQNAGDVVLDAGIDVGFDSYGHGYGVYVTSTGNKLVAARWRGDKADNFDDTTGWQTIASAGQGVTMGAEFGYPRIFVAENGGATIFYFTNFSSPTGNLNCSYFSAKSDGSFGTLTVNPDANVFALAVTAMDDTDVLRPILATKKSAAAVGYIKNGALNVFQYNGSFNCNSWTNLGSLGTSVGTVRWADLAINESGTIAAVMAIEDINGNERVYAQVYTSSGGWTGLTALDTSVAYGLISGQSLASGNANTSLGRTRPSVSIDSDGNAVATFSYLDTAPTGLPAANRRRAVVSLFF